MTDPQPKPVGPLVDPKMVPPEGTPIVTTRTRATTGDVALDAAIRRLVPQFWSQQAPITQGWYWHWSGHPDDAPVPTCVLFSGSTSQCFVSIGQLGITQAVWCADYGGWWLPINPPALPILGGPQC